jgi:hypothetical protein
LKSPHPNLGDRRTASLAGLGGIVEVAVPAMTMAIPV